MKKIFLFLSLVLFSTLSQAQQVEHFEPSSWWIGMKNPKLQVLVHGVNISDFKPSTSYTGVKITKVNKVENPNYLFLDLEISSTAKPGDVTFIFSDSKGKKITQNLSLNARQQNSANRQGYNASDVIYLITPDRFANGDPTNDGIKNYEDLPNRNEEYGRHGGDIKGISKHLDYIKDMGFTTIWPMPLEENNMPKQSYHGYAITDFYKIDPRFGTNQEYLELAQKANNLNLKLIRDVVLNHCGSEHWWMHDLPSKDWINNEGKFTSTNHARETHQDIHASSFDKEKQVRGWFVPSMPDLNQRNPFMANYIIQNTIWWIEYANLSGLRIDTYPYSEKDFLARWSKALIDEYPNLNMVGEEWSMKPSVVSYWQKGKVNTDGYVSNLPSLMDFPHQKAISDAMNEDDAQWGMGLTKIYQTLTDDFLYAHPYNLVVFLDNHDMSRFFTQIKEDPKLMKMALAYLLTTRGIPQIYYGTEIGMTNPKSDSHGEIRGDFPGGWAGDSVSVFENKNLNDSQKDLLAFTKKLLNWRKNTPTIYNGKMVHFAPEGGIYSFFRFDKNDKYWIVLNKNSKEVTLNLDKYKELVPQNAELFEVLENETFKNSVVVPAKGFRILKVKPSK
ncbi:glycoside hydrolase family 13 protein [Lacihabitans lacunae]|uniref:Glycoside hydrolase family 13 protein n=1 Tax=Lacihabitans lacunae TaxID=1028214 RepID=A0ABV7YXR6_9BACT